MNFRDPPPARRDLRYRFACWLRRLAAKLENSEDMHLHQHIARAFNLPRACRSFTIRWEVGHAIVINTECFPYKQVDGANLEQLRTVLMTQSKMIETGRFERP